MTENTGAKTRLPILKSHFATYSCVTLVKKLTSLGLSRHLPIFLLGREIGVEM